MNAGRFRVFCLWLADALCILLAWAIAVYAYKLLGFGHYHASAYLRIWPIVFVFTAINTVGRLYHGKATYPSLPLSPVEEFRRLVLSAVVTHVLVMAFLGFGHRVAEISRVVLGVSCLLTALFAQPFRDVMRRILRKLNLGQVPAVMVGDGDAGRQARKVFGLNAYYGFRIARQFHRDELRSVVPYAHERDIKHVLCCYKDNRYFVSQMPELTTWFSYILYVPTAMAFPVSDARAATVGFLGGLEMANFRRMKLLTMEKGIVDRLLASIIFILSIPFFVIVPMLIKLTSRGPVFYKAKRLGRKGRTIYVWKFRSMYADADKRIDALLASDPSLKAEFEKDFKLKNDPRVTPLGKFLRKTSIDELPQLFNVFRGEMALVGPRPIVEKEISYYGKSYEIFSSVKPGITGLWQASGRSDCDYDERVALDVHYILNWSPWMDLWIVFRTVAAVLKMRGSY